MLSVGDPRGRLFEHFVRLAEGLKPKLILFENVRGLVTARGPKGEPGEVLDMVRGAFEGIGYATTFALLNAADYGCPQRRVRCFMMAARRTRLPDFPERTHAEAPGPGLFGRRRSGCRWATTWRPCRPRPMRRPSARPNGWRPGSRASRRGPA